ncbi:hypothetical protein HOLleu_06093 [Holothuria leucospilota]|uniref:Uncharacterized protein n=1 Tax=Holothuria leucospilota TaxID=206669 RepID=A0A9Q1CKV4_HOLLE|nr:hypothetical protein HOLleu_06093 [Holothuria leucospilota]
MFYNLSPCTTDRFRLTFEYSSRIWLHNLRLSRGASYMSRPSCFQDLQGSRKSLSESVKEKVRRMTEVSNAKSDSDLWMNYIIPSLRTSTVETTLRRN